MKITILTLFPKIFTPLQESILKRAQEKGLVEINLVNIRDYSEDKYHTVDDRPYGGGPGMIMKVDILTRAIESTITNYQLPITNQFSRFKNLNIKNLDLIKNSKLKIKNCQLVLTSATGKQWQQSTARRYSHYENIIIVCGHYEGIDARITEVFPKMEEISIGKYVLTGGELAAMVMVDSIVRLIPGVLKKPEAIVLEPYGKKLPITPPCRRAGNYQFLIKSKNQKFKQYTRPAEFRGFKIPEVLLSGDPKKIKEEGY